jgi:hypothetical protein
MSSLTERAKTAPVVRVDGAGNVVLAWRKRVGATHFDLWARRFAGGNWGPAAWANVLR